MACPAVAYVVRELRGRGAEVSVAALEQLAVASRVSFVESILGSPVEALVERAKRNPGHFRLISLPDSDAAKEVKRLLACMDEGERICIDRDDFAKAFRRVDSSVEALFGPTRSVLEVFAEEQPDHCVVDRPESGGRLVEIMRTRRAPRYIVPGRSGVSRAGLLPDVEDAWVAERETPVATPSRPLSLGQERTVESWVERINHNGVNAVSVTEGSRQFWLYSMLEDAELMWCSQTHGRIKVVHFEREAYAWAGIVLHD